MRWNGILQIDGCTADSSEASYHLGPITHQSPQGILLPCSLCCLILLLFLNTAEMQRDYLCSQSAANLSIRKIVPSPYYSARAWWNIINIIWGIHDTLYSLVELRNWRLYYILNTILAFIDFTFFQLNLVPSALQLLSHYLVLQRTCTWSLLCRTGYYFELADNQIEAGEPSYLSRG